MKNKKSFFMIIVLVVLILGIGSYVLSRSVKGDYGRNVIECPAEEPVNNSDFCSDARNPHPAHWGTTCYRELVEGGGSGNQCCYSKEGEFCKQSPDETSPAAGKKENGLCKIGLNTLRHFYDDVLRLNEYNNSEPPAPEVGSSCPKKYKN
jgi:hypothetical protein